MKTVEQDHAKDSYTSIDVNKYFDNIYARNFALLDTPGFTNDLVQELQLLIADYRLALIKANTTYAQTFVTPFFQELKGLFDI